MVTIELSGGLGNQMFQYALAIKMNHLGNDVLVNACFSEENPRRLELGCFEGVEKTGIPILISNESKLQNNRLTSLVRKLLNKKVPVYKDKIIVYQPEIYKYNNVYLSGYWQNESYFADIRNKILSLYSFKDELIENWNELLKEKIRDGTYIEKENSTSIHVRRMDYLTQQNRIIYDGICTIDYYKEAVGYIRETVENPVFYWFSDDIEWVRNNMMPLISEDDEYKHVMVDIGWKDCAADMWLMTRCKHHIIANSTYSWWGAWLGTNVDKIVVAPRKWMNGYSDDIICHGWIRI